MFTTLSAMVVAVTMTLPSASVFGASYSQELQDAYNWAHENGVTTMDSIDNANMYGAITRAQMAKMLSVYAEEIQGKTPDTSKACTFSDIDSVKGDLHDFIIESCQLGIMGQGISAFRPYDTISRAEFGTALSRVLWGNEYEGGTPYYAKHLDALKAAGIMTQIDNPENRDEVRGYVMLMLMRAAEGVEWVDCEDPAIALACAMETDECPAACRDNGEEDNKVVKSGDLAVSAEANKGAKVISNGATSELDTLVFEASEDVTLNSITLERYGLSNADSIDAIWLEDLDGNEVTAQKSISTSKDTVTLSLKKDYKEMWTKASFVVVVKTASWSTSSTLGTNVGFKVTDVDSSAKNLDLSDYAANLYDFIDYTGNGVQVEFKGTTASKTYNYEAGKAYEVAKVRIYATKAAVEVNGFTLTNAGNLDIDDYVEDVKVSVNWTALKNVKSSLKNDELKVTFDAEEIAINKNKIFTVEVTLAEGFDDFGDTIRFKLGEWTDLSVVETKNAVRVQVNEKSAGSFVSPTTYTFNGAKINLTNTKLDKTIEAAQGSSDVTVAKGKIALGGQAIRIDTLTLTPSITGDVTSVKFVVDDESYEATAKNSWTVKKIVIEEDANVEIKVDVADNAGTWDQITFTVGAGNGVISPAGLTWLVKYDTNGDSVTDMLGSISVSTLKIQEAKGSLINNISKKVEYKVKDSTTSKTVFDGTFTAKKQNTRLNNVVITQWSTTGITANDSLTFHVYIDGDEVATFDGVDEGDFPEIVVEAGKSVSVKVDAEVYASTGRDEMQYKVQLKWLDENDNDVTTTAVNTVKISFVDSESITVTTNSTMKAKDVILTDSDQEVASFIVKPSNKASKANVDRLEFDVTDYVSWYTINSSTDPDEYFEVKVGKNDTLDLEFNAAGTWLVADDINIDIEWETNVTVVFKKELAATGYSLSLVNANGAISPRVFARKAVNALVRVATQAWDGTSTTKYTFDVEYSDNANSQTITGLQFTYADSATGTLWANVVEWETYTTTNNTSASDASIIEYRDGDGNYVNIDYATYPDYFRVSSTEYVIRYAK